MAQSLIQKAQKAGIAVEVKKCGTCDGEGSLSWPDPVDLKRWREDHDVGIDSFSRFCGVSMSYIFRVEADDPEKRRRCSDFILGKYLEIPKALKAGTLSVRKKGPAKKGFWPAPLSEEEKERRRLAKEKEERRVIAKGSSWKRLKPAEPASIVEVEAVNDGIVLLRDITRDRHRWIKVRTLLDRYQEIAA